MEPGYCTEGVVSRVIDADTIEVTIVRRFNVRVRNLFAPENSTPEGKELTEKVKYLFHSNPEVCVFIPTNDSEKLMDFNSFNRVVGDVYIKNLNVDFKSWVDNNG